MFKTVALVCCLMLATVLAVAASRPPPPALASAPAAAFSAGRAMADVRALAAQPHPIGSAEHDRVRDLIARRFTDLGLQVQLRPGAAYERTTANGEVYLQGGAVQNILAVLPGRDRSAPAVAVMAHYDTVPASPGAADDTTGVASALETARALKASGAPERDVMFLITDGEEAGLLGARAFFDTDPLAKRVGVALNMETRGGGGRVYMFQTGDHNGGIVRLFKASALHPSATSLAGYVYAHMPNDTDFTVARAHGIQGLNYAFIGRSFDYHAASSTIANLDQGSVQHMGEQVLAAARALGQAKALPANGPDLIYADILGGPVVAYPAWAGWALLALAALAGAVGIGAGVRREGFSPISLLRGAVALLLTVVFSGVALSLVRSLSGIPGDFVGQRPLLAQFGLFEAALAAAALFAVLAAFTLAGLGRSRFWSAYAGVFVFGLLAAAGLQAFAAPTAFLFAWPVLLAGLLAAATGLRWDGRSDSPSALAFAAVAASLMVAQLAYQAHGVAEGVGADLPPALAAFVLAAVIALFPVLWPARGDRFAMPVLVSALVVAVVMSLALRFGGRPSPRYPEPTQAIYVAAPDGKAFWRASALPSVDAWTRKALAADGGKIASAEMRPLAPLAHAAEARPVAAQTPEVQLSRTPDGRVTLQLAPRSPVREIRMDLKSSVPIAEAAVNGRSAEFSKGAGKWTHLSWSAAGAEGLTVSFMPSGPGQASVRYALISDGWPADAAPLPPRPTTAMPWGDTDSLAVIGNGQVGW